MRLLDVPLWRSLRPRELRDVSDRPGASRSSTARRNGYGLNGWRGGFIGSEDDALAHEAELLVAQTRGPAASNSRAPENDACQGAASLTQHPVRRQRSGPTYRVGPLPYGLPEPAADLGHKDDGWDLLVPPFGQTAALLVNVKWTRHKTGGLYLPVARQHKARALAFILVVGVSPMRIAGFAWRHTLLAAPQVDHGHGPGFYLGQSALHRVEFNPLFVAIGVAFSC